MYQNSTKALKPLKDKTFKTSKEKLIILGLLLLQTEVVTDLCIYYNETKKTFVLLASVLAIFNKRPI